MKKVIVCDAILDKGIDILRNAKDIEVLDASKMDKSELLKILKDYDVAITRSSTPVDMAFLENATNMKAIVRAGVGVDNVNIPECSKRGIVVMNVPGANTIAAVELTMAHLLTSARSFTNAHNYLKIERKWNREKWYGVELFGKTLGVLGFGNIGSRVATRAKAFGMNVIAYDPYVSKNKMLELGIEHTNNLDDILTKSDFITIHTPKTKETVGIIGTKDLDKLKDGVRFINCARGGLLEEEMLYKGLESGKIAWLGIDCFVNEPSTNDKLLDFENVSVTSHLGANTVESQENIAIFACEQALSAARGISYPNALNLPIKTEDLPAFVEPFIDLVSKMGYLAYELNKKAIKSIRIKACGEIAQYIESLKIFGAVGALRGFLAESINYVNAEFIMKEKGINIETSTNHTSKYANEVSLELITENSNIAICGSVFNDDIQRIVSIDGFECDFNPKGKMIILKNKDIPGVIAKTAGELANNNINIADFHLTRDGKGEALAVILVDSEVNTKTTEELSKLDMFKFVEYIEL